jgi:quinohemoprotein ethanol dehydrogenase
MNRARPYANAHIALILLLLCGSAAAAAASFGKVTDARVLEEAKRGDNWLVNAGNYRGQHYSPLHQIDTKSVAQLGLEWSSDLAAPDGIAATPIVVDGTIYLSGPFSIVYAIDAASGQLRWTYDPQVLAALDGNSGSWTARSSRGVAVWDGRVYVGTADCRLIALDAGKGTVAWTQQTCDTKLGYTISDAPRVGGGRIYLGNAGSESGKKNRGYVSAYDPYTGKLRWRFYTVPSDDPAQNTSPAMQMAAKSWTGDAWKPFGGGGNNWNEMTYDPQSRLLFFGTAGALPYEHDYRNSTGGDDLFTSSVLAINSETGEYVWHYQTVPEDNWDYNATMNLVLADLEIADKQRQVLMIAPKNGFFYVLDRHNGALISAEKYATVNWATSIDRATGRPVDPAGMFWTRHVGETVNAWPNMWGAHSWQPMAYDPTLRLVYIPVIDVPSIVTVLGDGNYHDTMDLVTDLDGKPHSPGRLVAWDPASQTARWTIDQALPVNGGLLATAGGLVFQGDAQGRFSAYDAASGVRLWSVETGSAINAAPVTYLVGRKQYVLVPIGAGGGMQLVYPELHAAATAHGPTRLLAFAIDGKQPMPIAPAATRVLPAPAPVTASADVIAHGAEIYAERCGYCHGKDAIAHYGGTIPDLRYASIETHDQWLAIVVGGTRRTKGMPAAELSAEDAEAVRQYVLSAAQGLHTN